MRQAIGTTNDPLFQGMGDEVFARPIDVRPVFIMSYYNTQDEYFNFCCAQAERWSAAKGAEMEPLGVAMEPAKHPAGGLAYNAGFPNLVLRQKLTMLCNLFALPLVLLFAFSAAGEDDPAGAKQPAVKDKPKAAGPAKPVPAKPAGPEKPKAAAKPTNRLAKETSPYLLQHAHNPVDWYPWGEEALAKAQKEGKLIFLSVGYSSCHWCHVMERESFLDEEIAGFLNKHFVCIKVDREERPDIDSIYMTALHVYNQLAGSRRGGGWPMSMFLTPDGEPVFGGTYFPARDGDRGAGVGFLTIVQKVQDVWTKQPDRMKEDAKTIVKYTKLELEGRRPAVLTELTDKLYAGVQPELAGQFDEQYGGFGFSEADDHRPKFPEPSNLLYLLDRVRRTQDQEALKMLVTTLEKMSLGGIRDHLGGGFHRYSVDRYWRIPHFEKMLYDNAQLASVYAEAYLLTGREDFRRVTEELLAFVLREMLDGSHGFYAALDADSEDEEGKFYRWDKAEVQKLLMKEEYDLFAAVYGLTGEPNFEEDYYVPQLAEPLSKIAAGMKLSEAELEGRLLPIRGKLLAVRSKRPRPLTDTKILTADNGLMIGALADVARCFTLVSQGRETATKEKENVSPEKAAALLAQSKTCLVAATSCADFVLAKLRTQEGRLLRTYSGDQAKLNAYLNDYAYLSQGLISLYRATGDQKWLTAADELTAQQIKFFQDDRGGGFFFTSSDHEALLARGKDPVDGAVPSGNSVAAGNLLFLAKELSKPDLLPIAEKTILSSANLLEASPTAVPLMATSIPVLLEIKKGK